MSQIRSFLAIDLDDDFKPKVNKIIKEFKKIDANILFVDLNNLHFTLKFFGDIDTEGIDLISKKIEIEVESLKDAVDCVENKADIVMLDNMSPKEVEEVLEELIKLNIRDNSLIEVSGGITAENIVDYAKLGIDIISLGALTHSSRSLNFSLRILED